jgi:Zn-finger nucleic acid-binding protein
MLMPVPPGEPLHCPVCKTAIQVPLQAQMRAVESGTAIGCPKCKGVWLYRLLPKPLFAPLATPKRKRGPKRYHPKEE